MTMLSVVIPAYNEENGITEIMQRVLAVKESLHEANVPEFELVVVNDGSQDKTYETALSAAGQNPCVRIISHPKNRGYGAALKTGFANSQGRFNRLFRC